MPMGTTRRPSSKRIKAKFPILAIGKWAVVEAALLWEEAIWEAVPGQSRAQHGLLHRRGPWRFPRFLDGTEILPPLFPIRLARATLPPAGQDVTFHCLTCRRTELTCVKVQSQTDTPVDTPSC